MGKKGIISVEYMVMLAIVVLALVSFFSYLTRAVCGHYKDSADVFGGGRQYTPP